MIQSATLDQLRDFTELGADWRWELDQDLIFTYSFCFSSPELARLTDSFIGLSFHAVADASLAQGRWAEAFAARRGFRGERFALRDGSGAQRWMSLSAAPFRSVQGVFLGFRGVGRDVSAEVEIERLSLAQKTGYDQLLTAFEAATDAIALWDSEERLVLCNAIYRTLSGEAAPLMIPGLTFEDYLRAGIATKELEIDDADPTAWIAERLRRFREGGAIEAMRAGRWLLLDQHRTPDGGTLITCSDITELKQREVALVEAQKKADQANLAKSYFLANMSHELRTPLNAILGYSEIVKEQLFGPDLPRYAEYAGLIHQSGEYLLSLINRLLDLTRIEADQYKLDEAAFSLQEALDAALNATRPMANQRGVALIQETDVDGVLIAERRGLLQILINLLTNAIKFSPVGAEVRLTAALAGSGALLLAVEDQGEGMTPEEIVHAFEAFRRGDAQVSRKSEGVGLGLAISQRLAKLHGGQLQIESEPMSGAKLTLTLPTKRCEGLRRLNQPSCQSARRAC